MNDPGLDQEISNASSAAARKLRHDFKGDKVPQRGRRRGEGEGPPNISLGPSSNVSSTSPKISSRSPKMSPSSPKISPSSPNTSPEQLNHHHHSSLSSPNTSHHTPDTSPDRRRHHHHHSGSQSAAEAFRDELQHDEEEEEAGFLQPNMWWFTSTAFPLVAGTFGPIANLFSVCGLVQTWRIDSVSGARVSDPSWLIALNVTSLVSALTANLVLLFNFAHRIRYAVAQPLTISLWYLSSLLLLIPLALLQDPAPSVLSQSFYYALISTVLYFTISTLLLLSTLGATIFHAYPPSFNVLTIPQRTLMLQTISFSLYLSLGAGIFSALEGWDFVDGVYWADYTLLTIGLGSDFPVRTTAGRMLLIPYAAVGITLVGLVVSSVRGLVLEHGKLKVAKRKMVVERQRWGERIRSVSSEGENGSRGGGNKRKNRSLSRREKKREDMGLEVKVVGVWHKAEFELMRLIEETVVKAERYTALTISFLVVLVVWIAGSLVFWSTEHKNQSWTYPESLYFSYTSLLTIGYGDFFPASRAGRPFFVIWSLIAVPAMTVLISNMGDTVVRGVQEATVWVGRRTILPEKEVKEHRHGFHRRRTRQGSSGSNEKNDGKAREETKRSTLEEESAAPSSEVVSSNELGADMEKMGSAVELAEDRRGHHGSLASRLAKEIREVSGDIGHKPPIRYEWDRWSGWLELIREKRDQEGMGTSNANGNEVDSEDWNWSWLSDEGPLFSHESETEWVLGKLCIRLEEVLEEELEQIS